MEPSKLTRANHGERSLMAPVTWEHDIPAPATLSSAEGTERTPQFEPAELADFGEGEGERTVVTTAAYELRPRFTGRTRAIAQLQELTDKAFDDGQVGFAVITGEPGMGKSRIVSELIARVRTMHPTTMAIQGVADENAHAYGPVARALTVRFGLRARRGPRRVAATRSRLASRTSCRRPRSRRSRT